ncbi:MAG: GGDEF domain-containing protein [Candidatus Nitricoxidivorans perseverans]|uniref:diguanylate cyclase n=1 Tax=Candidatus Nitricoxidivorans perseverans TaxID=2975601 RepID=A0AA49FMC7_9PROT|nr:MAG: GGDEF domain-containing protein [Candidatus Nitricoxidivorans perseverans]
MRTTNLKNLWHNALATILVEMNPQEIGWLLRSRDHISLLASRRTTMIVSRVRLIAALFAVLTPLWIVVDIVAFPREVWLGLVTARLAATAAFAAILLLAQRMDTMDDAYRALGMLLAVPTFFFLFSYHHMVQFDLTGVQAAFAAGYAFLPFVMLAGLSMFPLTLFESLAFATPMLIMQIVAAVTELPVLNWPTFVASFWLLLLITAVASLSGISQLAFMIVLVREAIRDNLTGCFSRNSGEELLDLQFVIADRGDAPMSLAFIDLDHFKQINDRFGHDAGDRALIAASAAIRGNLRTGDMLVRWGGEEFLLIMPNTDTPQACVALARLRAAGFGRRPDGAPLTASIGLAERRGDCAESWQQLVEMADTRMYAAKEGGRDRIAGCHT